MSQPATQTTWAKRHAGLIRLTLLDDGMLTAEHVNHGPGLDKLLEYDLKPGENGPELHVSCPVCGARTDMYFEDSEN